MARRGERARPERSPRQSRSTREGPRDEQRRDEHIFYYSRATLFKTPAVADTMPPKRADVRKGNGNCNTEVEACD